MATRYTEGIAGRREHGVLPGPGYGGPAGWQIALGEDVGEVGIDGAKAGGEGHAGDHNPSSVRCPVHRSSVRFVPDGRNVAQVGFRNKGER